MNALLLAAEIAAVAAAVGGQFYDCYTTYEGIFVQKTQTENGSGLSKLLTKNAFTTLTIKPLVAASTGIFFYLANTHIATDPTGRAVATVAMFAASVVLAVLGYEAGRGNAAANKASLAAKK